MTVKKYRLIKIITATALAILVAQSVILRNWILPFIGIALSMAILSYLRGKIKNEILADERDYEISGTAARWSIQTFSIFAVVVMIALYAKQDTNPSFLPVASTLAYSVCLLMFLYSLIFRYFHKVKFIENKNKTILIIAGIIGLLVVIVFGLRFFSGEDDWICKNGEWIKHGSPSFPAPSVECK